MISRNTDNFTGYIIQGEEKIYFHAQDKVFNFITEGVGIFAEFSKSVMKSPDHFLHGYSTDGYQIALYTGYDERKISANYKLRPGIYLVSTANLCSYDMSKMQAIEFIGGTLNNLYQQTQIATKYDEERKCYIKTYPVFKKEYSVKIKDIECKLILQNMPSENSPSIMNLIVRYEFPKEMPIKIIKLTYNVLMKICRFMTNRENVGFDEVRLYQIDDETGKWFKFADGFLDYQYDNFTNKKYQQNILFDDIDECIANLHSVMSADTEGKATYLFDFYSDNDKDYSIQIMKGYMASGAFSRGKAEIQAKASMVFVGNINQSVETLQKTSSLFDPFPPEMGTDTAFLDRFHAYIPGWEIPKYRPDSFTNDYGFITDYLSEFMRELRKDNYSNIAEKYFKLGNNLNQRDAIAVRKLISGFIKLIYPDGEVSKEEVAEIMDISLELRRRVKEQLKKIGGMEFYDVNFSYIDNDSFDEHFVSVPEQGGGKMIPEGMGKPGCLYTVSKSKTGMIGCYRLETQMMPGNGKLTCTGIGSGKEPKEATNTAFNYLKANGNAISGNISTTTKDYIINYQDMQGLGMTGNLALPTLIAISSAALSKPPISSLAVLGEISIGGTLIKVEDLASTLQVCLDSGAKKVLLPITSAADLGTVPSDLVGAFSLIFYSSPEEAVYKALGVE